MCIFGSRTFIPISWMCKKQTSVSPFSTESEIISLDAGLRMDGLHALDLWDVVTEVLRSTSNTERPIRRAPGNWCGTANHSSNVTKTTTPTSPVSGNRDGERSNRDVDQLSNLDYVPSNTPSSQGEFQLYIFEDNEGVIKMIIEGRSPTMRDVSRTHRVALDWLFDRINSERKIQIKYVDTKNQLADMLTKGSFTRDEWNHLLRLFNIVNFSMFSCSHFSNFLSDPIRKQSAMSMRGQEATSSEGSPMAKPKPINSAMVKSRSMNLVLPQPVECEEEPSARCGQSRQPGECRKEQGGALGIRKLMRNPSRDPIEDSQVKRQENTHHADSWKQEDTVESSSSTGTRKPVREVNTQKDFHYMRISNHQYLTKVVQHS